MNKMLSNDCLGTQELHTFCKTTDTLEHSHPQDTTLDKTAVGSTLISHQNVCCTAEVSGENTEIMEISLLQDESDAATTSLLPLPLLSCGPRSMGPSSSDLESILSPDPIYSDLQLKEINYNAAAMDESTEFLHLILSGNDEGYNTTTEFQVWDVLDFYVTENFSSLQFDSLMGFTNEVSTSYNYNDCMNLVDMVERPVARLSLDDTPESNNTSNEVPVDHTTLDPDETSLYLQTKPTDSETESSSSATGDVVETEYLDQKLLSRGLPDLMDVDSPSRLTKTPVRTKHVTLVLDLDGEQALTSHYAILLLTFFFFLVLLNICSPSICSETHLIFVSSMH
ncbi:hypothetical protein SEVIR_5G242900v4 [Setaria viridis]